VTRTERWGRLEAAPSLWYDRAVTPSEPLATGTLLTLDGRGAGTEPLSDPNALDRLLRDLAQRIEGGDVPQPERVVEADGSSHVLLLDEAHLMLHAFPEQGRFAFLAFSRHAIGDAELQSAVSEALGTGRSESSLRRRASGLPRASEALARRLAGERAWARARLVPQPSGDAD